MIDYIFKLSSYCLIFIDSSRHYGVHYDLAEYFSDGSIWYKWSYETTSHNDTQYNKGKYTKSFIYLMEGKYSA
ncbi:hypothetical protein RVBP17_3090 [Pseudomonas phage sp. 30-3]|uniref:Uncharacterized protein n=1 Tax=Pseudomonas phage vB_PaeM_PA5oct TaxID=2163605 RepID=A0A4Y5JV97_9CAUD|nr:hypothetical protein PQE65_gp076 [Pseudomonas phage vB_PaeM_PA5oct]WMI31944.1 hypothetical protein GBBBJNDB_00253 [Pseudomonas phage Callisto]WPK38895.1 hypothetical protein Cassandra_0219 [Pseudomonas phage Cassandra]WPK39415.1 hypothetical protein Deiofobo_0218 [Pseudomonas phage Deifobo]WPK39928.1 hypothetical protein ETTORE_0219 [Pseudomonas phage Ettore]WPK40448.1 hypothetical protein Paride_0218 [Pseudomonas phage Paride]VOH55128.1 hypothetical protein MIJ3_00252 [Pseudomonas phage v